MRKVTVLFYGFFLCVINSFIPLDVKAGLLGPDSYEDCVLEKMKDQPKNMMSLAQEACEKKFPYEKALVPYNGLLAWEGNSGNYNTSDLELSWCDTGSSSISICVSKNETDYRITKAIMAFSTKCDGAKPEDFREKVTFTFSRWRDKSTVDVKDATRFKCMRQVEIYGERAK